MRHEFSILAASLATILGVGHYLLSRRRILRTTGLSEQQREQRLERALGGLFYAGVFIVWMWSMVFTSY